MVTQAYFDKLASVESGNDPLAQNPKSSAKGRFQFVDSTAKQYGLDKFEFGTPEYEQAERTAAEKLTQDNAAILKNGLGRDPTNGELYLAHQQGANGALSMLQNRSAKAVDVLGKDQVLNNGGNENMTVAEFSEKWTSKFNDIDAQENGLDGSDTLMGDQGKDTLKPEEPPFPRDMVLNELKRRGVDLKEMGIEEPEVQTNQAYSKDEAIAELRRRGQYHLLEQVQKQGKIEGIKEVVKAAPEETITQRLYKIALEREQKVQETTLRAEQAGIPAAGFIPKIGNAAAFIGDVGFEVVKTGAKMVSPEFVDMVGSATQWAVSSIASTPPAQFATQQYGQFKQANPVVADNIEGGLNTAFFMYPMTRGAVQAGAQTVKEGVEQTVKQGVEQATKATVRPAVQIDYTKRGLERILKSSDKSYAEMLDELKNADVLTIADIAGDEVQGLTRSIGKMEGAKNFIHQTLTKRSEEAVQRVSAQLSRTVSDIDAYFGHLEDMVKARGAAARPLYERAYAEATDIQSPELKKFVEDKRVLDAIQTAKTEYGVRLEANNNSLEVLDKAKVVLWDKESVARESGANGLADSYKTLRQGLVEVLDGASPTYARARKVFEHPSKMIDAQKAGLDFNKLRPEQIKMMLSKMSPDEIEAYRIGVRESLQKTVSRTADEADPARRIFGNSEKREQLKAIFPEQYDEFAKQMQDEMQTAKTKFKVLGGSRTDYNIASDAGFIDAAADAARRGVLETITDKTITALTDAVKRRYIGINDKNAKAISEILLDRNKGIEALQKLIDNQTEFSQRVAVTKAVKEHGLMTMFNDSEK